MNLERNQQDRSTGIRRTRRGGGVSMDKYTSQIARNKERVRDALQPQSFTGRLRSEIVRRIPWTPLRNALEQAPIEDAINNLRGPLVDLYNDMGDIIREGRDLVEFHSDIRSSLDEVEKNPDDWELLRDLREKMREKGERDLNLRRNPDTEELMQEILEPDDPEKRNAIRGKTIFEAKELLTVSEIIANIGDTIAINTAQAFETGSSQYALLLNVRRAIGVIHRGGMDTIKAQEMRIQAWSTLEGQIEIMLLTGKLATEVQLLASEARVTVDADKLLALKERSESLREETFRALLPGGPAGASNALQAPSSKEDSELKETT